MWVIKMKNTVKDEKDEKEQRLLKCSDLLRLMNCSRSTFNEMLRAGTFPRATVTVGCSGHRWPRQVYSEWLAGQTGAPGPSRPRSS